MSIALARCQRLPNFQISYHFFSLCSQFVWGALSWCQQVSKSLSALGVDHLLEVPACAGVYSIDIAIPSLRLAIEVLVSPSAHREVLLSPSAHRCSFPPRLIVGLLWELLVALFVGAFSGALRGDSYVVPPLIDHMGLLERTLSYY